MKYIGHIPLIAIGTLFLVSCNNNSRPNYRYFSDTDMYESVAYKTYEESHAFYNGIEAQTPAEGTIKRGWEPYKYANTNEAYESAKLELKSPIKINDKNMSKGKELYGIYCAICHGAKGDGQGILVKREKILGVPNYKDRNITEGSTYHVMYYGRNFMGSHAGQISNMERWQVVMYVEKLRNNLLK